MRQNRLGARSTTVMMAGADGRRKYAILVTGEPLPEVMDKHGDFEKRFKRLLAEDGAEESWDAFKVFRGERCVSLGDYDGVVVTGSKFDAHGQDAWIADLMADLRACHERRQRVLGICFGHQVLARSLGGKVERAQKWSLGANKIAFDAEKVGESCGRLAGGALDDGIGVVLRIHQIHQDEVSVLPPDATAIASSPECENEAFVIGSHIFCVQGHPEFDDKMVADMLVLKRENGLDGSVVEEGFAQLKANSVDELTYSKWSRLCRAFLKSE
ncbi:class I glutamine amidotransferase [Chloropicon primus]|uniref:Class I glutamine amidotransferase n=1 Tax=Chloropicon primus TaxID=1764295 RepID=A0A5B8MX95_9CHLO|nr:class I glutamine amidotransferase [Chloropicon primus]UPR03288.1 class I glutamine amidotransferase [Chloropicon primus]|eukprot:QDZ24080.1 class I glutamine amidotransferase [Chloropicon primus]